MLIQQSHDSHVCLNVTRGFPILWVESGDETEQAILAEITHKMGKGLVTLLACLGCAECIGAQPRKASNVTRPFPICGWGLGTRLMSPEHFPFCGWGLSKLFSK